MLFLWTKLMNANIETILDTAVMRLRKAQIPNARLDARILLAGILGCEAGEGLFFDKDLTPAQSQRFFSMIDQRCNHKPVDKILGTKGFYKYDFQVDGHVLSPRPDTEVLVEAAIDYIRLHDVDKVLDLGTGSGCILLSVLSEFSGLNGVGVDVSQPALNVAQKNAEILQVSEQTEWKRLSWFSESFINDVGEVFDVIVSNPPYIPNKEIEELDDEVKNYDPLAALDGGEDGLESYRRLAVVIPSLLKENGMLFLEVGKGQAAEVGCLFCSYGLKLIQIIKDLGGIERCVILKK